MIIISCILIYCCYWKKTGKARTLRDLAEQELEKVMTTEVLASNINAVPHVAVWKCQTAGQLIIICSEV